MRESMNEQYDITFDENVNVDPVLRKQISRQVLRAFLKTTLPGHEQIVFEAIQRTPTYLEWEPTIGYWPYVASQHTLISSRGEIKVGVRSEMMERNGKQSIWHTTVTTVEVLKQWIEENQELPN
jgi:hypothetical protein